MIPTVAVPRSPASAPLPTGRRRRKRAGTQPPGAVSFAACPREAGVWLCGEMGRSLESQTARSDAVGRERAGKGGRHQSWARSPPNSTRRSSVGHGTTRTEAGSPPCRFRPCTKCSSRSCVDGREWTLAALRGPIADDFGLTDAERQELHTSNTLSRFDNRLC